jgi:hypothetical protein
MALSSLKMFNYIFQGLSSQEVKKVKSLWTEKKIDQGEKIILEGEIGTDLILVGEGSFEISKKGHTLSYIITGETAGEIGFLLQEAKRTATVTALEKSIIFRISRDHIPSSILNKISKNVAIHIADRLKKTNENIVVTLKKEMRLIKIKNAMGSFIYYILTAVCLFFYITAYIRSLYFHPNVTTIVSVPLIIFLFSFMVMLIKKSGYPLSSYGLNLNKWQKSLIESLIATILILTILTALKWVFIHVIPSLKDVDLFRATILKQEGKFGDPSTYFFILIYSLFAPVQELMVRGCLQESLERFLSNKQKKIMAIFLSNLLFSSLHLQLSISVAISVFFVGCSWGWLYARHRTILGVSISHIIIGVFGGWILGYIK